MLSTIMIALAIWLGLNAAFVAIRICITADQVAYAKHDFVRYRRAVNAGQLDH